MYNWTKCQEEEITQVKGQCVDRKRTSYRQAVTTYITDCLDKTMD